MGARILDAAQRSAAGHGLSIAGAAGVVLAATALGLGTCWIAAFDPAAAREVLGLPDDVEPIAFTPLGYAADAPGQKKRRPLDELVKYDHW